MVSRDAGARVVTYSSEFWHSDMLKHNSSRECHGVFKKYASVPVSMLVEDEHNEMMHCMVRSVWKSDDRVDDTNTTCDVLMRHDNRRWQQYDSLEKRILMDCATGHLVMLYLRAELPELAWLPLDLITNPYRQHDLARQMVGLISNLGRQIKMDYTLPFDNITDINYRRRWEICGLNCSHYNRITSEDDLVTFRLGHNAEHYIAWNNKLLNIDSLKFGVDVVMKRAGKTGLRHLLKTVREIISIVLKPEFENMTYPVNEE